jgi:hypothetical protein
MLEIFVNTLEIVAPLAPNPSYHLEALTECNSLT